MNLPCPATRPDTRVPSCDAAELIFSDRIRIKLSRMKAVGGLD